MVDELLHSATARAAGTNSIMELIELDSSSRFHKKVSWMFSREWKHPNTKGKLVSIYVIKNAKDPKLKLRFHGTQRACRIGAGSLDPCDNDECYVCGILKKGFTLDHANLRAMFGPGIYSTVVSSKADIYAKNHHVRSHKHVILLCGLDLGTPVTMYAAGLPGPCDSVEGATKAEGGALEYRETVVYDPARIKPIGLVVYTREGWTPR